MRQTWLTAAVLLLLGPGLAFAQRGRVNPSVVGNPSYTGYGPAPTPYIPGALGNPSYTGYNAPRYGTGFNPSYTGYDYGRLYGTPTYGPSYSDTRALSGLYRYNSQESGLYAPLTTQSNYYAPQSVIAPAQGVIDTGPEERTPKAVTLKVRVPTPATEVWVEGGRTTSRGMERTFVSPKLEPGTHYTYEVRARWMQDGKEVDQTRQAPIVAGQDVDIDFSKPEK